MTAICILARLRNTLQDCTSYLLNKAAHSAQLPNSAQLFVRCSALPKLLSSPYTAQLCLHVSALLVKAEHITVKLSTRPAKLRNTLQSSAMLRDAYDAQ